MDTLPCWFDWDHLNRVWKLRLILHPLVWAKRSSQVHTSLHLHYRAHSCTWIVNHVTEALSQLYGVRSLRLQCPFPAVSSLVYLGSDLLVGAYLMKKNVRMECNQYQTKCVIRNTCGHCLGVLACLQIIDTSLQLFSQEHAGRRSPSNYLGGKRGVRPQTMAWQIHPQHPQDPQQQFLNQKAQTSNDKGVVRIFIIICQLSFVTHFGVPIYGAYARPQSLGMFEDIAPLRNELLVDKHHVAELLSFGSARSHQSRT